MNIKVLSIPFLLLGTATQAVMIHPLNDLKVIEVDISRQGLTRITVKEDRILNVFGLASEYILEADEDQGQIFVRPMGPGSLNPISLTITTEKGYTQDLRLIPKEKAPEALILKDDTTTKEELRKETLSHTLPNRKEIEDLLESCQEGRIPLRYKLMPLDLRTLRGPYLLIREIRGDSLKGPHLQGLTYEVKNTSKIPLILSEEAFAINRDVRTSDSITSDVIAVLLTKKRLNPGERTTVHVIAKIIQ